MGLQRSAAGILGTIRDICREGRARSCATAARLVRGRYLALYPAREHSDPENVFRPKRKTVSFARVQPYHPPDRKYGINHRRNYRRIRGDAHQRARRPRPGSSRTQRNAKAKSERILMIADRGVRSAERKDQSAHVAEGVMSTDDFRRRTFRFGILVARLVQTLSKAEVARVIGNQLLRSGTAVGANYRAAARARSRADSIAKMRIVEVECDE